ncbi:MAG: hypothetical protein ABFD98_05265 [Syntrophobacteraceae bacterium]
MRSGLSSKGFYIAALAIFFGLTLLYFYRPLVRLPSRVLIDCNEGWNAFASERLLAGEALYPRYDALISNNYPPLSFYVNAGFAVMVGDHLIAGRIISLLSLFIVAGMLGMCLRQMGGRRVQAAVMQLFFLASIAIFAEHYVAMADPQWLGHAIQATGLYLLLKSGNRGRLFYLSIFLMAASGFIKHSLIVLPAAVFLWLLVVDRPALVRFTAVGILLAGLFLAALTLVHGTDFLHGLFSDCRKWSLLATARQISIRFNQLMIFVTLGVSGFFLLPRSKTSTLLFFYFALACIWGAFMFGGEGIDWNALFDMIISGTLIGGALLIHVDRMELQNSSQAGALTICVLSLLAVSLIVPMPYRVFKLRDYWKHRALQVETVADDIRYLAGMRGPVMCEDPALCYWAGKRFEVDMFMTGAKVRAGVIDREKFTDLIESRYFSAIQISRPDGESPRLDEAINRAIRANYAIGRKDSCAGVFYVPK